MKKLLCTLVAFTMATFLLAQETKKGLAIVNKRKGVEIYVMCEPVRDYEVTGEVTKEDLGSWLTAATGNQDNRTVGQMIDTLINNANRKAKKKKLQFDAILTEDGQTGTLIKFKPEEPAPPTSGNQ
jgi:hypothetical protein